MKSKFYFLPLVLLLSCTINKNAYDRITDLKAKEIIAQTIAAYGGLENWKAIKELSFSKWYALYDAEGHEEVEVNQQHNYNQDRIYISWEDGPDFIEQTKIGNQFIRKRNGKKDPSVSLPAVTNSTLAARFVMDFPYNLLDLGTTISYIGEDTFMGRSVHVLKVIYHPETQKHHTTKDVWWHYIDTESLLGIGYKVKHLDHISLVKNLSFHSLKGFTLPGQRSSFRLDEYGNELFLRAEYTYDEYAIEW